MSQTELKLLFLVIIAFFLTSITPVYAAGGVGKTVKITRTVIGSVGNRKLAAKQPVYKSEKISAKTNSYGELRLLDNSRVVVGANSSIVLDEFVVGRKKSLKSGTIKVAKGAFRFISGNSSKGAYTVKTPASTIGVRGTIFDVYVRGGTEYVLLLSGGVNVCAAGRCVRARRACDIIETRRGRPPALGGHLGNRNSRKYKSELSLVWSQRQFNRKWRAPIAKCAARAAMEQHRATASASRNQGGDRKGSHVPSVSRSTGGAPAPGPDSRY